MSVSDKTAAIIPCFNEAACISDLVREVQRFIRTVVVVDDGSQDGTEHLAAAAGARVLRHKESKGKGAALTTGWRWALEQGFESALCMDGDGQHSPTDIPRFLNATPAPLIVGNRMANPAGMPWVRKTVNRWMSRKISNVAGQELPDTQCGFRLMNLKAWSALELKTSHFEIESELLLAFVAAGHAVQFVPVQVIYRNEVSKIHPLRDTMRWFRWWRGVHERFAEAQCAPELTPCDLIPTK